MKYYKQDMRIHLEHTSIIGLYIGNIQVRYHISSSRDVLSYLYPEKRRRYQKLVPSDKLAAVLYHVQELLMCLCMNLFNLFLNK